ncbi:MAG: cell wall-binding repeat-containing protein [Clostridium argentinense]|nr:cell wall-binding repeat-containing protein [Clostridium argentinense]
MKNNIFSKLSLIFLFLVIISASNNVQAKDIPIEYYLYQGNNRYETSAIISNHNFDTTDNIIIASGENFQDALIASSFAKSKNAPILLVSKNEINDKVKNEILDLKTKKAYIIGNYNNISQTVENTLKELNLNIERIYGKDYFETSIKVASMIKNVNEVFIASVNSFADSISISSISAMKNIPILFTNRDSMPENISNYISENKISKSYIIGGTGVISDEVKALLPNAVRIDGKNRYETNFNIIKYFEKELDFTNLYMTKGSKFPDAIAISVVAGNNKAPILLLSDDINEDIIPKIDSLLENKNIINKFLIGEEVDNHILKFIYEKNSHIPKSPKALPNKHKVEYISSFDKEIFNLTNDLRKKHGLAPLIWDDKIYPIAKYKSNSMIQLNYFSHGNPNYNNAGPAALAEAFNYNYSTYGENILMAASDDSSKYNAKALFSLWLNSPSHKEAMLNPNHKKMSVSIAKVQNLRGFKYVYYGTQHFSS